MDERRFDHLTRIISEQPDRRSMLKAASGGALAVLGASVLGRTADAQDVVAEGKGFKGSKCDDNNDCKKGLVSAITRTSASTRRTAAARRATPAGRRRIAAATRT
ncbi:MAG: hypothetical protein U0031_12630 [Thermomicrobiales bacterium]